MRIIASSLILALLSSLSLTTNALSQSIDLLSTEYGGYNFVPGQFIIRLVPEVRAEDISAEMLEEMGGDGRNVKLKSILQRINAIVVDVPETAGNAEETIILESDLSSSDEVLSVDRNWLRYATSEPDDSRYADQWFHGAIKSSQAWEHDIDASNVVVAVIDTGIYLDHEDLRDSIWTNPNEIVDGIDNDNDGLVDDVHGWDFFNNDNDPGSDKVPVLVLGIAAHKTERLYERHGTHVACVISCERNNKIGVAGVSNAKILPLKILGGARGTGSDSSAIAAIDYAITKGVKVINLSWGGGPYSAGLEAALKDATEAGIVVVSAAGNGGADQIGDDNDASPHYPSSFDLDSLISVAAVAKNPEPEKDDYRLTKFSNFGRLSVDIGAPGQSIVSAVPAGDESSNNPSADYMAISGTSMATPIITGIVASTIATFPALTNAEVVLHILETARHSGALEGKVRTSGIVDFAAAVQLPQLPYAVSVNADANVQDVLAAFQGLSGESRIRLLESGAVPLLENASAGATAEGSTELHPVTRAEGVDGVKAQKSAQSDPIIGDRVPSVSIEAPKELIIRWRSDVTSEQKLEVLKQVPKVLDSVPLSSRSNIDRVIVQPSLLGESPESVLQRDPNVLSVDQNFLRSME